jgi:hypothetical protein
VSTRRHRSPRALGGDRAPAGVEDTNLPSSTPGTATATSGGPPAWTPTPALSLLGPAANSSRSSPTWTWWWSSPPTPTRTAPTPTTSPKASSSQATGWRGRRLARIAPEVAALTAASTRMTPSPAVNWTSSGRLARRSRWSSQAVAARESSVSTHSAHASPPGHHRVQAGRAPGVTDTATLFVRSSPPASPSPLSRITGQPGKPPSRDRYETGPTEFPPPSARSARHGGPPGAGSRCRAPCRSCPPGWQRSAHPSSDRSAAIPAHATPDVGRRPALGAAAPHTRAGGAG